MLMVADQETVGKLAELDMIVAELERSNNRVATVERRNVRLLMSSVSIYSHHPAGNSPR